MRTNQVFRLCFVVLVLLTFSSVARAQVVISVGFAPPELPLYEQPICPGDGYIWTPGYWAWDGYDYYWVPGTWILAPQVGYFWTPPYWGWGGSAFIFHAGYWGPVVGFYGGINYGFGYFGHGFEGGRWDNGHFFYNRAVTNVNVTVIHNVYETRVTNIAENRVSYNGGRGGIDARPTAQEEAAEHERHLPPVAAQNQHMELARANQQMRASVNHGKPPIAASAKPGDFHSGTTAPTSEGRYTPPARYTATHASELPPHEHMPAPHTGNPQLDKKYQQQQDKLYAKQQQEHQKMQQQQEKEDQQMQKRNASQADRQQQEQRHQQQTQQMEQRHAQETQKMQQQHQPAPAPHEGGGKPR
ncbi:MAG TPA: YXWGXW repeat-containing protein [Verrucomicrobiae bacterium]|nr:YXWGXW repeat-containing protein [Verrucomicrobiae bacterium]